MAKVTNFSQIRKNKPKVFQRLYDKNTRTAPVSNLQTFGDGATIPDEDAYKIIDKSLYDSIEDNMVIANDILGEGNLVNDHNDISKTIVEWYGVDADVDANTSMSGQPKSDGGGATSNVNTLPIPIIRSGWTMPKRNFDAFQQDSISQEDLDTRMIAAAGRSIGKEVESLFLEGSNITVNNSSIPGLLNHPNVNTGSLNEKWNTTFDSDLVGDIESDILEMINDAQNNGAPAGNSVLDVYYPTDATPNLTHTINDNNSRTLMDILEEKPAINSVNPAYYLDGLSDYTVLVVYRSPEFMSVERGADFSNVEWEPTGQMVHNWASLGAMVLRVTPSYDDKLPVVKYTKS